jgi:hypothetical protein
MVIWPLLVTVASDIFRSLHFLRLKDYKIAFSSDLTALTETIANQSVRQESANMQTKAGHKPGF